MKYLFKRGRPPGFLLDGFMLWIAFLAVLFVIVILLLVLISNTAHAQTPQAPQELPNDLYGWLAVAAWFGMKVLTMITPSTIQGRRWYNLGMKILNTMALNAGKAKNKDDIPLSIANKSIRRISPYEQKIIERARE